MGANIALIIETTIYIAAPGATPRLPTDAYMAMSRASGFLITDWRRSPSPPHGAGANDSDPTLLLLPYLDPVADVA